MTELNELKSLLNDIITCQQSLHKRMRTIEQHLKVINTNLENADIAFTNVKTIMDGYDVAFAQIDKNLQHHDDVLNNIYHQFGMNFKIERPKLQ